MEKAALTYHKKHRNNLLKLFSEGLLIIKARDEYPPICDMPYIYRQEANFLYLTGIDQTDHVLMLDAKAKRAHLFIPNLDEKYRVWIGKQHTKQTARKAYGISHVHYMGEFDNVLKLLSRKNKTLYFTHVDEAYGRKIKSKLKKDYKLLSKKMASLRVVKSDFEMANIRIASKINELGFRAAMRELPSLRKEYEVQAVVEKEYAFHGSMKQSFPTIAAAGRSAATIHYVNNDAPIKKDDLVLIDAGCRWNGYASDLTRTLPASGRFTKKQKEIYQIVLDAQKACIKMLRPGVFTGDFHRRACEVILEGLQKIGIFKKGFTLKELFDQELYRVFFPHGVGHLLGLDVHDVGAEPSAIYKNLRSATTLKTGMVITAEPGIYFIEGIFRSKQKRKLYKKYVNWRVADSYYSVGGVRIEDNILITKTGYSNLTKLPKEIKDIEHLMK